MSDLIKISYAESCGDDTYVYNIKTPDGMTIRQFIDEWMKNESEWGYFGIADSKSIFGSPRCEYTRGKIKGEPLPDYILDKKFESVCGSGGWTRSDFIFKTK